MYAYICFWYKKSLKWMILKETKLWFKRKNSWKQYFKNILWKMSKFLMDTLAKISHIFLHILLIQNILGIFLCFEKKRKLAFFKGGGRGSTPLHLPYKSGKTIFYKLPLGLRKINVIYAMNVQAHKIVIPVCWKQTKWRKSGQLAVLFIFISMNVYCRRQTCENSLFGRLWIYIGGELYKYLC